MAPPNPSKQFQGQWFALHGTYPTKHTAQSIAFLTRRRQALNTRVVRSFGKWCIYTRPRGNRCQQQ